MPRLSKKCKEFCLKFLYDWMLYEKKGDALLEEFTDPFDLLFAKWWIANRFHNTRKIDIFLELLTEIENENKILQDPFIHFLISFEYFWYYKGHRNPLISKEQATKYFSLLEQASQNITFFDEWDKNFVLGHFYNSKAQYEKDINHNLPQAIKIMKKSINFLSKIPGRFGQFQKYYPGVILLGEIYLENGNFEEAEIEFTRCLDSGIKTEYSWLVWILERMSWLSFLKGDLKSAISYSEQQIEGAKNSGDNFQIYRGLAAKANYLFEEEKYEEALNFYQESLEYRKQHHQPVEIFKGYLDIFYFHYERFERTQDRTFLKKASNFLPRLQELSKTYPEDKTIVDYTKFAHALLLKYGNIREKAKAIDLLEDLVKVYPTNSAILLLLIELLIVDAQISEDQEIIDQIDDLMANLSQIPLQNDPKAVFGFISQQIIIAKYHFYITGNVSQALKQLDSAKVHLQTYKLRNLLIKLDNEIIVLEKELNKWKNINISIKERIEVSNFAKYLQEALTTVNKHNIEQ